MTGILQPLDVAVNRSFQAFYNNIYDEIDEYMTRAFGDTTLQTKLGNIKSPSYMDASSWIDQWMKTRSKDDNMKAFKVCGLYPGFVAEEDNIQCLHQPLRDCFSKELNREMWLESYGSILTDSTQTTFFDEDDDDWEVSAEEVSCWYAIYRSIEETETYSAWRSTLLKSAFSYIEKTSDLHQFF